MEAVDEVVAGRYRLLELIGTGGMGRVWRAEDRLLERTVAVKEILLPSGPSPAAPTIREARAAARLDHPGVVTVYDVVQRQGRAWIVMEYVASRSLAVTVRDLGPLTVRDVAETGLSLLAALRAAHAAGVLHRDVKPENVLLAADGRVVLTDFGLATIGTTAGVGEGGPDPRLGSPQYLAPERLTGAETGAAGDLFSLGATLYYAVEGRAPFTRGNPEASLIALVTDPPDPPVRAGALGGLLLRMLAKEPGRRPSASEVADGLTAVLTVPPVRGQARVTAAAVGVTTGAVVGVTTVRPGWRRGRSVAVAGVLLALAGGGAAAAAGQRAAIGPSPASSMPVSSVPAPSPPATVAAGRIDPCGYRAATETITAAADDVPAGLPHGWVWFRDPAGFALALPSGWERATRGNEVCFTDPAGRRAFTVNVAAVVTRRPLEYWQQREKATLATGELPGYARISMGVLLLRRGGADWEYTWRPGSSTVRHERRVLVAVGAGESYLLRWAVADDDWSAGVAVQRRLVSLFGSGR
ncbi:serine/threonine-protein kinase [Actinoplanes sp. NBRC 101535]|uniref:serine/threonine-protein kinase n=1 Tax=Actinoplanes sp. NBRC 101535 TaxID=3032196 RepID=UPI0024A3B71C|nr:serine/threonine-protein kinase [Actinoplanes sp. NBRC 101535]GLY03864.1 hypothetical protein Acsp01_42430 [Actinoplanes sp. NBRC 101535]